MRGPHNIWRLIRTGATFERTGAMGAALEALDAPPRLRLVARVMGWPFSRAAVLIPLVWWSMYLISKQRVLGPVMNVLQQSADEAGLVPVPVDGAPVEEKPATVTV